MTTATRRAFAALATVPVLALAGCSGGAPGGQDASFADAIGSDQGAVDFCTKLFGDPKDAVAYVIGKDKATDAYYWQATRYINQGDDDIICDATPQSTKSSVLGYVVATTRAQGVPAGDFPSPDGKHYVGLETTPPDGGSKMTDVAKKAADHIN